MIPYRGGASLGPTPLSHKNMIELSTLNHLKIENAFTYFINKTQKSKLLLKTFVQSVNVYEKKNKMIHSVQTVHCKQCTLLVHWRLPSTRGTVGTLPSP